jgi:hypothetical protein
VVGQADERPLTGRWLRFALPVATVFVLLAVPLLLLLTPLWTHVALDLSAASVPGGDRAAAHAASDQTVAHLVFGGDFVISAPGTASLFTAEEAGHMRDVRVVLYAFLAAALAGLAVVAYALLRLGNQGWIWGSIRRGAAWLIGALVLLGLIGVLAFGVAFEMFHRILFPGGNWAFSPDSNLIRLYPYAFWQLSAAAFGALALAGAALTWLYARARMKRQVWT